MTHRNVALSLLLLTVLLTSRAGAEVFPDKLFPPDAVVNITLPPYNAKPDDNLDDTKAIQQAITDNVNTGRTLYFPAGVYDLSDSLVWKDKEGRWRPHLTLQGQSREKSILRLKDNTPAFNDPQKPKPMIVTGSFWEPGDSEDGGGNKAFRNNIFDLTVDVGTSNPGATGIEWAVSNFGAIENAAFRGVQLRERLNAEPIPPSGFAAISMRRRIPGPGLVSNVKIDGFDYALDLGDGQYGLTMDSVVVQRQWQAAFRVRDNLLHAQNIISINTKPALVLSGANSVGTLLHASMWAMGGEAPDLPPNVPWGSAALPTAVQSEGSLFLRQSRPDQYRSAQIGGKLRPMPDNGVFCWPDSPDRAKGEQLIIPLPTPTFWNSNLTDWTPVGPRLAGEKDDTQAIQRAIDSGKSTVYFINDRIYFISDTIVLRGTLKQLLGMGSEINLGAAKEPFSDSANPRPLIRIDETDHKSDVFIENVFFNAQYPGEVIFENNSPATLVIRHCGGWVGADGFRRSYQNTPQSFGGKVFIEDCFLPGWRFEKQKVWARQFNPENYDGDGSLPQVENIGGDLWILGFKTEGAAPFIVTRDGARTELLGAYNYISATAAPKVPADAVPYIVKDASAHLTFTTDNFRDNDYAVYVRSTHGDVVRDWKPQDLPPRNGNPGDRSHVVPLLRVLPPEKK